MIDHNVIFCSQLHKYRSVTLLFVHFSYSPTVVQEVLDDRDSPTVKSLEALRKCSYTMLKQNLFANTYIILAIYFCSWYVSNICIAKVRPINIFLAKNIRC